MMRCTRYKIHKDDEIPKAFDEEKPKWDIDIDIEAGLEARNCLNYSRTWGSKIDGGVVGKWWTITIEGATTMNFDGQDTYVIGIEEHDWKDGWNNLNDLFTMEAFFLFSLGKVTKCIKTYSHSSICKRRIHQRKL